MSRSTRLISLLQATTAVALVAAIILLLLPPHTDVVAVAPTLPALSSSAPPMPTSLTALTDSIVDANIFSLTREAPRARTVVAAPVDPVQDSATTGSYGADAGVPDSLAQPMSDPVPALYGVVDGPAGRAALVRLDRARKGAQLYRIGEGVGGTRVRSIGADRVELSGPDGRLVLRMRAPGKAP
jgi:hypothetical protein